CLCLSSSTYQSSLQHSLGLLSSKAKHYQYQQQHDRPLCRFFLVVYHFQSLSIPCHPLYLFFFFRAHIHSILQTPHFSLLHTSHFLFHPLASSFALALHIATRSSSPLPLFIIYSPLCSDSFIHCWGSYLAYDIQK
ncbi:hypothetical protein K439DRAFT_1397208, partial [Ramaria rubella]